MNFLTPLAFLGALLAVPIILLYMLRLRRREVVISSTFLWRQVMQDREANTPWQRLRRNLLLFLQLLILLFLVLTLARPYVEVPAVSAAQTVLLLDASASMNATDVGGGTRFQEAQREALQIVDTLSAGHTMAVIRVSDTPEVLVSYTSERDRLRSAIQDARPSLAPADWNAALNLAVAGRTSDDEFTIVIVGDGGLGETAGLPGIEGELRYVPIGVSGDNVAITALATRALPGQTPQLFSQITNYGETDAEVVFSLRVDGELVASELYTIPAGGSLPVVSSAALAQDFRTIEAGLTLSVNTAAQDFLAVDNTAYTVSAQPTERRVLVMTEGNLYLEQILRSLPGLIGFRGNLQAGIPGQPYDLYIFDGWLPDRLPQSDMLIINPPRSTAIFTLGAESMETSNPRTVADDPRLESVDFRDVSLLRFRQVTAAWAERLITVDGGAVLLAGETGGRQVAILPFDLRESDLPLQIAWPVLMANLMDWFTPRDALTEAADLVVGQPVVIRVPGGAEAILVAHPDGETRRLPIDRAELIFTETTAPGFYRLDAVTGDRILQSQTIAVNLFSPLESRIAPAAAGGLRVGDAVIPAAEQDAQGQRELWPFAAALALLIVLIEWYAYHRRLQVPTVMGAGLRRRRA